MELVNVFNVLQEVNLMQEEPIVINVFQDKHLWMDYGVKLVQKLKFLLLPALENVLLVNVDLKRMQLVIYVFLVMLDRILDLMELVRNVHEDTLVYLKERVDVFNVLQVMKPQRIKPFVKLVQQELILLMEQIVKIVNQDILLLIQPLRNVKHVLWVMETRVILRFVLLVMQDLVHYQERFVLLVNLEKSQLEEDHVFHVLRIKEISDPQILVMLVLLVLLRLKEDYVCDVLKAHFLVLEEDVLLVLLGMNLIRIKQDVWNVIKDISQPMENLVFFVHQERLPLVQER